MAQAETVEFGAEQGQMLLVLTRHCRSMKRQETRLRAATALLLAAFLATLLLLQYHQQTTDSGAPKVLESISGGHAEALKTRGSRKRHLYLQPTKLNLESCLENQPIKWAMTDNEHDSKYFKLENDTVLQVFAKGLYLINLMISYRIAHGQCNSTALLDPDQIPTLDVSVTQWHPNYGEEIVIVSGTESMLCREYWWQTITLSRVAPLEAGTRLRVKINQRSCTFFSWLKNSHLDVTFF